MITALDDIKNAVSSFHNLYDAYLTKPVDKTQGMGKLQKLGLIPGKDAMPRDRRALQSQ